MKDTAIRIPEDRPLLIINEDNDHYFNLPSELMTEQALRAYVDDIAQGGHVTHLFLCPFGQRPSYASGVCEPIWAGMEEPDMNNRTHNIWCVNAKLLHDRGLDPYKVWIARCREKDTSPWLSIRMNDVHFITTKNYFRTCNFWREHPELRRDTGECKPNVEWERYAFDYSKEPVRQFHFAIFRELVDRYEPDGVELDWMRFTRHLTPGREREQAHFITEFIRDCRQYANAVAKRCGHPISLSVRVPTRPEMAFCLGFSPVEWAAEGLVDLIVATNFFGTNDFAIPMAEWDRRIGEVAPEVIVLPGATDRIMPSPQCPPNEMGIEYFRAWGDLMYSFGAKGLYLFNEPYLVKESRDEIYSMGMTRERLAKARRRFPLTFNDVAAFPEMAEVQLPKSTSQESHLKIHLSNVREDSAIAILLGFKEEDARLPAAAVSLNGIEAQGTPEPYGNTRELHVAEFCKSALLFRIPAIAARNGVNYVGIAKTKGVPVTLTWVEIDIDGTISN